MRALPALFVIAVLAVGAGLIGAATGSVVIVWHGREIYTDVRVLAAGIAALALLAALLLSVLVWLVRGPGAFLRARRERRRRNGYRALTQGMVAVAAGDAEEAQKFARKADMLLAEPPLTLLLSAQAAQLKGDEQAAARYFTAMLDRAETEFLGLRGLIMQALRRQDEAAALKMAERAHRLRPKTPWVVSSLFELQARAGRWAAADETLAEASKCKALPAPASRHHRSVLYLERSREAEAAGAADEALRLAAKAHALDPGFAPSAVHYAGLLRIGGRLRRARKVIESAWRLAPHPALATAYDEIYADQPPLARVKLFERLKALQPAHVESALALAGAALKAQLWGEARRHLGRLTTAAPDDGAPAATRRVCLLLARLEDGEHPGEGRGREWLDRALTAPPDPTYVCARCGAENAEWQALCGHCHGFDTLAWRRPAAAAVPVVHPDAVPALLLPVPDDLAAAGQSAR